MNSADFRLLIKNFTGLTPDEYAQLKEISSQYPYSQILHIMNSRASRDLGAPDQTIALHQAAVYSTDRAIVKWAMTLPASARIEEISTAPAPVATATEIPKEPTSTPAITTEKKPTISTPQNPLEGDLLREDLAIELRRLQQLKQDFEASYESFRRTTQEGIANPEVNTDSKEPALISEIKSSKKKSKVVSTKAILQNEIIDQFINTAPALPKPKSPAPETDLAEDSNVYSDNIVSETLVSILVKQGKNGKAIEMLKKLIWKFPQKKAYFAAQIEELKN